MKALVIKQSHLQQRDIAKDKANIDAVGTAKTALAGLTGTPGAAINSAVADFKTAFAKADKNLMSDAQIKAVTDAITAFEADATPDLTKAKAIGTAYTAPAKR